VLWCLKDWNLGQRPAERAAVALAAEGGSFMVVEAVGRVDRNGLADHAFARGDVPKQAVKGCDFGSATAKIVAVTVPFCGAVWRILKQDVDGRLRGHDAERSYTHDRVGSW
jgi:hypothetical protein